MARVGARRGPLMDRLVHALLRRAHLDGVQQFRVGAVVARGARVLLLRRAPGDSLPGLFELPSGGVEANEGIIHALVREVAEETGLRVVSVTAYAGSFDYLARRSGRTARQFNFVCAVGTGEVRLRPDEHDLLLWADHGVPPEVNVSPEIRAILDRYWAGSTPTRSCPGASA